MTSDSRFQFCKSCETAGLLRHNKLEGCIQGQGDCNCMTELVGEDNRSNLEKSRKIRNKFRQEITKSESKGEEQKMALDDLCYCFTKQVEFSDKTKEKEEKKKFESFDDGDYFWDSSPHKWSSKCKNLICVDQNKENNFSNSDQNLTKNILEFKEKVDFLFQIFKENGQQFSFEDYAGLSQPKEGFLKEILSLFEFHKRLCAAEEGIVDLANILEDLVQKKAEKNLGSNEQMDFEEMSVSQRINYLKKKNDLLLGFVKTFLKVGSVEDTRARLCSKPNDYDLKKSPFDSKFDYEMEENPKILKKEGILETLRKLRMRMLDLRAKKSHYSNELKKVKKDRKVDNPLKYSKNKLEVISEQAELLLSDERESESDDVRQQKEIESLTSHEESKEVPLSVTSRILAEEAEILKLSLDKVHFELLSKLDSTDRNFENANSLLRHEKKNSDADVSFGSSSDNSCVFWDNDCRDNPNRNMHSSYQKCKKQKELNELRKEKCSKEFFKQDGTSSKRTEIPQGKSQAVRRIQQMSNCTSFSSTGNKPVMDSIPEVRPSSSTGKTREVAPKNQPQRPITEPSFQRKLPTVSYLKPLDQDKYFRKNSGTFNVKSKNKILLSKKSCVETS